MIELVPSVIAGALGVALACYLSYRRGFAAGHAAGLVEGRAEQGNPLAQLAMSSFNWWVV